MTKIHQQTIGEGKAIVLIHGWAMHSGVWRDFATELSKNYKVTCIDLPGHGYSQNLEPFELEKISDEVVNELKENKCCWLGWSLGSLVVLDISRRYPDKVSSLILLAGSPKFISSPDEQWSGISADVLNAFAESLNKDCKTTLLRFLSLQLSQLPNTKTLLKQIKTAVFEYPVPDSPTLLGGLNILKQTDLRAGLARLTIPVSCILGEKDTLVSVTIAEKMQALLPTMNTNIIKGAGHVPFLSHPQQVLEIISEFMEQQG